MAYIGWASETQYAPDVKIINGVPTRMENVPQNVKDSMGWVNPPPVTTTTQPIQPVNQPITNIDNNGYSINPKYDSVSNVTQKPTVNNPESYLKSAPKLIPNTQFTTPKIQNNTTGINTPSNQTPSQQTPNLLEFRQTVNDLYKNPNAVGWDGQQATINGVPIDLASLGFVNQNGRFMGTADQIASLFGLQQLRSQAESQGIPVGYDATTGQVSLNGKPVDTQGLINIGGRYYGTQEALQGLMPQQQSQTQEGMVNQPEEAINPFQKQYDDKVAQLDKDKEALYSQMSEYQKQLLESTNANQKVIDGLLSELATMKGSYDDEIKQLIQKSLAPFDYNPESDIMLKKALKEADRSMMEEMSRRGLGASTYSRDNYVAIREELMPKYQQIAYQQYNDQINKNLQIAQFARQINQDDFDRYSTYAKAAIENAYKVDEKTTKSFEKVIDTISEQLKNNVTEQKNLVEEKYKALTYALDRLKELSYADNEVASILNIKPGTPSAQAQKEALDRINELKKLNIQHENRLEEIDYQGKVTLNNLREQANIKMEETQRIEQKKAAAQSIISQLSSYKSNEAMQWVNDNLSQIIPLVGDNLSEINKALTKKAEDERDQIQKNIDNYYKEESRKGSQESRDISRGNLSVSQQRLQLEKEKKDKVNTSDAKLAEYLIDMQDNPSEHLKTISDPEERKDIIDKYGSEFYLKLTKELLAKVKDEKNTTPTVTFNLNDDE